ncbi:uncharacterized protein I206_102429 [Kwoniella pini CBS 10737]|uniref:AAA+ ATPase domain-containing protein n=1 Tax=Kwoniella pini CBS 10737 TaxID=1296096 RepID=A0A1B9I5B6_9TREE|nr:uncharacterized protein I206_02778 [Kwoniella pini CBS 10737]OCF50722.1 hypothetical protein I206_02778 [Kwoniella pini CBS 10737]
MSESTTIKPLFEPTDIFNFDFPTPPLSNQSTSETSKDASTNLESELEITRDMEIRSRSERMILDSPPPPDYEEEPDFDEDELAMMELERETITLTKKTTSIQSNPFIVDKSKGKDQPEEFVSSGIFEESETDQPIASSSRLALTPPPESDLTPLPIFQNHFNTCTLPSLRAETMQGKIITFKRRNKPKPSNIQLHSKNAKVNVGDLLSVPLHKLLAEVDELKSQQEAIKLQQKYDEERRRAERASMTAIKRSTVMWVDKYRPKQFTDLLGEDRVHRDVMNWLKEWDKCVFKRVQPGKKRKLDDENFIVDPLGRPRERILLLSGPPGYGKTTLAHIVARHAGYKTLEINASDDRLAATVSTRIKNAIDAGSGLASDGKPTCVVIDEIDGASGGGDMSFIRSLLKLIQDVPARKKSNTPARPLRRPIICICNDLYASSLRPLRPFARVIRFKKPQSQILVKRLREICDRETLSADLRVLTTLVDVTSGDVRSCLNTLQFIKSKSSAVTDEAIRSSSVGMKDSGTSLQNVWNTIFIPLAAKQKRKAIGIDNGRYVDRLSFTIQASGEYDKVVQGLFEHYPNVKPLDASLGNLCKVHDWLGYYDHLSTRVSESQEWDLMGYMPYAITAWYHHLAAPANNSKPTEWPKADYEAYQARIANEEISTSLKNLVPPILRSLFSTSTLLTEFIPLIMRIISPPLKPVNANIVKAGERAILDRLVDLMIPLGLRFWQEKGENGQPMMRLEPPIDVFVHYEGKRADDIAASRFAVRQLVAQAIEAEIARRKGAGVEGDGTTGSDGFAKAYGLKGNAGLGKRTVDKAELPATDFFGRTKSINIPLLGTESPTEESVSTNLPIEPPIKKFKAIYKFNEGSSSAVRKSIKMSTLM